MMKYLTLLLALGAVPLLSIAEDAVVLLHGLARSDNSMTKMEEALDRAQRFAQPGDAVLLSPACSSFDMYESYEERGNIFRRLVKTLL